MGVWRLWQRRVEGFSEDGILSFAVSAAWFLRFCVLGKDVLL